VLHFKINLTRLREPSKKRAFLAEAEGVQLLFRDYSFRKKIIVEFSVNSNKNAEFYDDSSLIFLLVLFVF